MITLLFHFNFCGCHTLVASFNGVTSTHLVSIRPRLIPVVSLALVVTVGTIKPKPDRVCTTHPYCFQTTLQGCTLRLLS